MKLIYGDWQINAMYNAINFYPLEVSNESKIKCILFFYITLAVLAAMTLCQ